MESNNEFVCERCLGYGTVSGFKTCDHCGPRRQGPSLALAGWYYVCDWCNGTGVKEGETCIHCSGDGYFTSSRRKNSCRECHGERRVRDPEVRVTCPECRGLGTRQVWNPVLPQTYNVRR